MDPVPNYDSWKLATPPECEDDGEGAGAYAMAVRDGDRRRNARSAAQAERDWGRDEDINF